MDKDKLKEGFFAAVFNITSDTIRTEKEAKKIFKTAIIPTPREISKSCGFAIRFFEGEEAEIDDFLKNARVNTSLYFLSGKEKGKSREAILISNYKE